MKMPGNTRIEPEAIEVGYKTVSSIMDYTVERTVVERETSVDKASYGVQLFSLSCSSPINFIFVNASFIETSV